GTDIQTLANWQTTTGFDANSKDKNPFYSSISDLSINQILLDGAGISISGIPIDIDSTIRSNPPDIGAREFSPCTIDAGVNLISGLSNPLAAGLQNIEVELQNQGSGTLTSVEINWTVNGQIQIPFIWSGNLISAQNEIVQIGTYTFVGGSNYDVSVWTTLPNNQADCDNYNDTTTIVDLSTPLCGNYTIGGTNPHFQNFTEAVTILNNAGISCPVVFYVRDGIYSEQIEIGQIQGVDSINTVSFIGENLDSSLVSLEYTQTNNILNYTLNLNNTEYIYIRHISIKRLSGNYPVWIQASNNIEIANCKLYGSYSIYLNSESELVEIKNCHFDGNPNRAIRISGTSTNQIKNISINNNIIPNSNSFCFEIDYSKNIQIFKNSISNFDRAIDVNYSGNVDIENNMLENGSYYGIEIYSYQFQDSIFIKNNIISNILNDDGIRIHCPNVEAINNFIQIEGIAEKSGIYINYYGDNSKVLFNSINVTNTNTSSRAIYIEDADNLDIRNNIFSNSGGGYSADIANSPLNLQMDYNNYFSSGNMVWKNAGTDIQTLANWQTTTGFDANSMDFNPYYESYTELRPYQREINGAGISIPSILYDIDNQIRDQSAPDIGADEFMVDFGVTDLISPTLHCALTANDSVTIYLKQFGDIPFLNITVSYQVNNGQIFTETISGSTNNDLGFTFSATQNLQAYGTYVFKIWIVNSFDDNINNDTLIVERYSHSVPAVDFTYDLSCAGVATNFYSNTTVSQGWIEDYFWDFGDQIIDTLENPIHLFDTSGTYLVYLQAFTEVGCYNDTSLEVQVMTTPQSNFFAENICFSDTANFVNTSSISQGIMNYEWDFGDNNTSTSISPQYIYQFPDTFEVSLISISANLCTDSIIQEIIVYPLPILSLPGFNSSYCENENAQLISPNLVGGLLSGNGITGSTFYPNLANLGTNIITYAYTDIYGCSDTLEQAVDILPAPSVSLIGLNTNYCISAELDTAMVQPAGGILSGTGLISNIFNPLLAGIGNHIISYSFTDANSCTSISSQTVTVSESNILLLSFNIDSISCYGYADAAIDLTVSFTSQTYSEIEWSNGETIEDISGLNTGIYELIVSDIFGCRTLDTVEIIEPTELSLQLNAQNVLCFGEETGSISAVVSGGTEPFSFNWSNNSNEQNPDSLSAGYYFVSLTDFHGCNEYDNIQIQQPSELQFNPIVQNVSCFGFQDGEIDITLMGGTNPYSIFWSTGQTSEDLTNLPYGIYTINIIDGNACKDSLEIEITQPQQALSTTIYAGDIACHGQTNGYINLTINGGTAPYQQFIWSNGMSDQNISGILAGTYYVTVIDANNCETSNSATIIEPPELEISFSETNLLCYGDENGQITTNIQGGTPPYISYVWNSGQTTANMQSLFAGTYTLTITDQANCTESLSIEITQPPNLIIDFVIGNIDCYGNTTGTIDISFSGATPPYSSPIWENGETENSLIELAAGVYSVSISDDNNCLFEDSAEILEPEPIQIQIDIQELSCFGFSDGSIDISVSGGTMPVSHYFWSNSSQSEDLTDLPAGTYGLTVVDQNFCRKMLEIELLQPDQLVVSLEASDLLCFGNETGKISSNINGGLTPYTFAWSNGENTDSILNLYANEYSLSLTDANNCESSASILVAEPEEILANENIFPTSCEFANDGSIKIDPSGGSPPYSIFWDNTLGSDSVFQLSSGYYELQVSDSNNCIKNFTFEVPISISPCLKIPNVFTPNGDEFNELWLIEGVEFVPQIEVKIYDRYGQLVFDSEGYQIPWDGRFQEKLLPSDAYFYSINLNNGSNALQGKVSIIR
ncbi:MAG: T9SS type B sorting domain-containing protein, partial [Bacteroidetes bacterium]|nr:T9SS type B sorting domain-containing protein [Bacteroidota bacterium]